MEHFCKELLPTICVDYNNKEVQDIMYAVDILMKRIVKEIGKTNPDIKIKDVLLCGSNAEKTRVWGQSNEIEFDYLAVMKTWPGIESFRFEQCADGQMNVQYLVNNKDNQSGSKQYISLSDGVSEVFRKIAKKCVSEKCQQNLCPQFTYGRDTFLKQPLIGCRSCSVSMYTGTLRLDVTEKGDRAFVSNKMHFVWKSKYKSIKSVNVGEIRTEFDKVRNGFNLRTLSHHLPLPEFFQYENMYHEMFSVPVDFHPVIEINQSAEVHQKFQIFLKETYVVLPHSYVRAIQRAERYRLGNLKEKKLADFIFKLIFTKRTPREKLMPTPREMLMPTPRVKLMPELDRSINYFLFPKAHFQHTHHGCWRISSCLQERDILCQTSEEHRSAYCLLKFLAQFLFEGTFGIQFHNYEIKISVINHIKLCKTPTVGAHVCMLRIMHDLFLNRSKSIMEHPILRLNFYEMIPCFPTDRQSLIRFKVLILLLAYERGMYSFKDLFNDMFSIQSIYSWHKLHSLAYYQSKFFKITERDLFKELKEFIRNRRRNSSKDVMSQLITDLMRKKPLLDIKDTVLHMNTQSINVL